MDRKLLSREAHEIAYVRKIARQVIKDMKRYKAIVEISGANLHVEHYNQVIRISKAVLKFAKYNAKNKSRRTPIN